MASERRRGASARLAACFAATRDRNEAAFIPFLMAGDRGMDTTSRLLDAVADAGADAIELGVPFSDPMADGPVLQRAAERALACGATLQGALQLVAEFRKRSCLPIVLFGYANPFLHYGPEALAVAASASGVDGLLCVDMPPDEAEPLRIPLHRAGIDMIFLLAPTSTEKRIARVLREASGFVYFVSVSGVTGVKPVDPAAIATVVGSIQRQAHGLPVGVGFGISTATETRNVAGFADAVIVGSAIARLIEQAPDTDAAVAAVGRFAAECKSATRRDVAMG